jgi:hypothetical protein
MRHRRFGVVLAGIVALFSLSLANLCSAQVTYSGGSYTQNFDALPNTPTNTSLQSTIPWTDNSTSSATQTSIPGWYLYHSATAAAEGGTNQHQRFRNGSGSSGTGSFYSFGTNATTERALGDVGSSTIGTAYFALRLTNNTGGDLGSFTLSYTGEQWRDGGDPAPAAQTMTFGYAVAAVPTNISALSITSAASLNFQSPTFTNTGSGAALDGNAAANRTVISSTVGGFLWANGTDLWLRWADIDDGASAKNDHGLSIDDLTFTAGPPADVNSAQSGLASAPATWSDNLAPHAGYGYHVINGHTVTLDGSFVGSKLSADNGTVDINSSGNGQNFGTLIIGGDTLNPTNGNLTESVTGDVTIGADSTGSALKLNRDVAFTLDAGETFRLKAALSGAGNIDFNSAAGASVSISQPSTYTGTIRFNGTGDVVSVDGPDITRVEMNSTGLNKVVWASGDVNNLTFNAPGIIDHATTAASRLQGGSLTVNAQVTADLTKGYPDNTTQTDERRMQFTSFSGSGNVIVNGTAANYTNAAGDITLNEFELNTTGEPTGNVPNSSYSGTMTFNNYVNGELRFNLKRAGVVINQNARVEFGFQVQYPDPAKSLNVGEITVNNGGTLEVGFEQGPVTGSPFYPTSGTAGVGNHVAKLNLTSANGRSGGLTMTSGATLRMQINGLNSNQYDAITATGNVNLGGATLDLLANAVSTDTNALDAYFPTDGDTFTLISIVAAPVQGDYDGSGTVDQADYNTWRAAFGTATGVPAADGNNNGVVDAGDYVVWLKHLGQSSSTTGTITGDITINKIDPFGSWGAFTIEKIITATSLQIKFHSAGSGASLSAVPEPSTLFLGGLLFACVAATRQGRVGRKI